MNCQTAKRISKPPRSFDVEADFEIFEKRRIAEAANWSKMPPSSIFYVIMNFFYNKCDFPVDFT